MTETARQTDDGRVFTLRALFLGLVAGLFVCSFAAYNDWGIRQNFMVGNHLPLTVYSSFFAFLLVVNPLMRRFGHSAAFIITALVGFLSLCGLLCWLVQSALPIVLGAGLCAVIAVFSRLTKSHPLRPFSTGELVVTLSMTLVACSLPTSGLFRNMTQILVMPQHYGKTIPDWEKSEPDRYVTEINPNVFPARDEAGKVYDGYVQSLTEKGAKPLAPLRETPIQTWFTQGFARIGSQVSNIPYGAWIGPAMVWLPILIVSFIFIIAMCRIVHRQWSENEQLSYPIAEFANTLIKQDLGRTFSDIFYNRIFWIGLGAVFLLHLINGWFVYEPKMIKVPMGWSLWGIWNSKFTYFNHTPAPWYLLPQGTIFLTVVAFAYFLPEEISFSLGISMPLFVMITATSYQMGHPVTGDEQSYLIFGSYVAMAAVIFYTGRHYYSQIFRNAILFRKPADEQDRAATAAARWFLGSTIAFILLLMNLGLDWLLATMMVFLIGSMFIVLARASAETGIPFMGTPYFANKIILALLGPAAIGPAALYLMQLVTTATMQDNRECLAPYVINGLRLGGRNNAGSAPLSRAMMLILIPGVVVAGAAMLYVVYGNGSTRDDYMGRSVPEGFAREISRDIQKLKRSGQLETSKSVTGLERLSSDVRDTQPAFMTFFLIGIALVAVNSMLRLRYVWWPLHPVTFLCWAMWASSNFIYSFLLGWLIKVTVVKLGGGRVYQSLKPLFIGIILGDLSGGMFWMLYGPLRFFWTGEAPKSYGIFPG